MTAHPEAPAAIAAGLSEAQRRAVLAMSDVAGIYRETSKRQAISLRRLNLVHVGAASWVAALTPLGLQVRALLQDRDDGE